MAIKDWKKIKSGKYGELWSNNKTGETMSIVYYPDLKSWSVRDRSNGLIYEDEKTTKKAILNSAKSYMRKN